MIRDYDFNFCTGGYGYPYTNMQNANLDWIIDTVKKLEKAIEDFLKEFDEEFDQTVLDIFNKKMADGEFDKYINDVIFVAFNTRLSEVERDVTNLKSADTQIRKEIGELETRTDGKFDKLKSYYINVLEYGIQPNVDMGAKLNALIKQYPNRTFYFPDGEYITSVPIKTSADVEKKRTSFELSPNAVIKAVAPMGSSDYIFEIGAYDVYDWNDKFRNVYITGGLLNCDLRCGAISVREIQGFKISNITVTDFTRTGIKIYGNDENHPADTELTDIWLQGWNVSVDTIGIDIYGTDCRITNYFSKRVHIALNARSGKAGGLQILNMHPVGWHGYEGEEFSTAITLGDCSAQITNLYSDQLSTAIYSTTAKYSVTNLKAYWFHKSEKPQYKYKAISCKFGYVPVISGISCEFYDDKSDDSYYLYIQDSSTKEAVSSCNRNKISNVDATCVKVTDLILNAIFYSHNECQFGYFSYKKPDGYTLLFSGLIGLGKSNIKVHLADYQDLELHLEYDGSVVKGSKSGAHNENFHFTFVSVPSDGGEGAYFLCYLSVENDYVGITLQGYFEASGYVYLNQGRFDYTWKGWYADKYQKTSVYPILGTI